MTKKIPERIICMRVLLLSGIVLIYSISANAEQLNKATFPVSGDVIRRIKPRSGQNPSQAQLVERGRQLFTGETFGGNGRTCATCHPPANNFTLDPGYIARLPPSDPLFVAERNPGLATLENPFMLRRYALLTENLDGFDRPGVLRSVPHVLGLGLSTTPAPGFPLAGMTGWSGDGAPGDGSLREFAVGAVVQHLTKTLQRQAGVDFRVPTGDELDALLAYMLSLGQQATLPLDTEDDDVLTFRDAVAEDGLKLFNAPLHQGANASCSACHYKAGANTDDLADGGHGTNFDTGVATLSTSPSCLLPPDGGFGKQPTHDLAGRRPCAPVSDTGLGDGTFNTPSLVAAAETPPFFHNNAVGTLEQAVAFYTTDTFKNSPAGTGQAFALDATGIQHITGFLRAVNALENIVEAKAYIDQGAVNQLAARSAGQLALSQVNDAIAVLEQQKPKTLFADTHAADALRVARAKLAFANPARLVSAKADLERARSLMVQ